MRNPLRTFVLAVGLLLPLALGACQKPQSQQPPPYYGGQPPPYGQPYPQQPYPGGPGYPPPQGQLPPGQVPPGPGPGSGPQQPPAQRPLLAPLIGTQAMQQELRSILAELVNALNPQNKALVQGIPLVFDPTIEVNAFAGCENGQPFLAATQGIFDAVDAMAQTRSTDELFRTNTYDAYTNAVLPNMVRSERASAALPQGIIPTQFGGDARRWSRAHEMFDEIMAFTFGHELAHHYLGHTGCAKGQTPGTGPDPTGLGRLLGNIPIFSQGAEASADAAGCYNSLDAGRARRPNYEWNEAGGVALLDFFGRLEKAAGVGGLQSLLSPSALLRTHPNPVARAPLLQGVARTWHQQHP